MAWSTRDTAIMWRAEIVTNFVSKRNVRDFWGYDGAVIFNRYYTSIETFSFSIVVFFVLNFSIQITSLSLTLVE